MYPPANALSLNSLLLRVIRHKRKLMSDPRIFPCKCRNSRGPAGDGLAKINRRHFLKLTAATFAFSAFGGHAAEFADQKKRVGLIGCGWYGKCDLFRLIQVAPIEVVSLCDVDKRMLTQTADMVAERQRSKRKPRTYGD